MAASGQAAVVGQRLGESHADARADARGKADEKSLRTAVCGKRGGEERRERRNRAVHQTGESGLDDLQEKKSFRLRFFVLAQFCVSDFFGGVRVVAFFLGKVAEQLADSRVRRPSRGDFIKPQRLDFHRLGGFLNSLQAERTHKPDGFAIYKTAHVLPPDVRDMVAETRFVKFKQAMAMAVFLAAHLAEFRGLFGIIFMQSVGEILVNARVLFFQRNGERENFLFGKAVECFHK